jgi:hypothetical protein
VSQVLGDLPIHAAGDLIGASSGRFNPREKYLLLIGSLICFSSFWLTGKIFRIPSDPHFSAAILEQSTVISTLLITALLFAICVVIGSLIAGVVGFDAGVCCACVGLCAFSARGGAIRYTLFDDPTSGLWLRLTLELALLAGILAMGTALQQVLCQRGLVHGDDHRHVVTELHESVNQRLLALVTNVIVMSVFMVLIAASDRKVQVVGAVAISSFLGTLAAYYLVPTKPSANFWVAPILVGIIGYMLQYFGSPAGWQIGEVRGTFAALARPLPLDYVGAGGASSIIAYWMSRRWQHEREISTVAGPTTS